VTEAILGIVMMVAVLAGFVTVLMVLPELEKRYKAKQQIRKEEENDRQE
jgi:uncharacterized protein with PQ loop repeat